MPDRLRTVFGCTTPIVGADAAGVRVLIEPHLRAMHWWSPLDEAALDVHRGRLLASVSHHDAELVEQTFVGVVYDVSTRTFGLLNAPNGPSAGVLHIRLFNDNPTELRNATRRFVEQALLRQVGGAESPVFRFDGRTQIDAYVARELKPIFQGQILLDQQTRRRTDLRQRARNRRITRWMLALALIFTLATIPPLWTPVLSADDPWYSFATGFLGRLGTAALFLAITAWLDPFLNPLEDDAQPVVRWDT